MLVRATSKSKRMYTDEHVYDRENYALCPRVHRHPVNLHHLYRLHPRATYFGTVFVSLRGFMWAYRFKSDWRKISSMMKFIKENTNFLDTDSLTRIC